MSNILKELAKTLNLIDTIEVANQSPNKTPTIMSKKGTKKPAAAVSPPAFTHLIVVDFEATCWTKESQVKFKSHEIIEFPAVLLNLTTGCIEAEFHKYVAPTENPLLSDFCTELTGIAQSTVDGCNLNLATCLRLFNDWVREQLDQRNLEFPKMSPKNPSGNVTLASWSDWDFQMCLSKECARKKIRKDSYFQQWIDMRQVYRQFYRRRPNNFGEALAQVGIDFQGRQHSGIDDARNLASLVIKMLKDGVTLAITKDTNHLNKFNRPWR